MLAYLYYAFFDLEAFLGLLSFQFSPNLFFYACLYEAVARLPDGAEMRNAFRVSQKIPETQTIRTLILQFRIRQAIRSLQNHTLHQQDFIRVRTTPRRCTITVNRGHNRDKRLPINHLLHTLQTITQTPNTTILLPQNIRLKTYIIHQKNLQNIQ